MNNIDAKDSRDLKDGKDAAGVLGGRAGLADGAGWAALCTKEASAEGGRAMQIRLKKGIRDGAFGLQRPLKARKGRLRPLISDAFVFSVGGQEKPPGCRAGSGTVARTIRDESRAIPENPTKNLVREIFYFSTQGCLRMATGEGLARLVGFTVVVEACPFREKSDGSVGSGGPLT